MKFMMGVLKVSQTESVPTGSPGVPPQRVIDWDEFVATESPRLYRYFLARFAHPVACDLVQETLLRLVSKVDDGTFDPTRGSLIGYAFGLAHFVAREGRQILVQGV
jgi:hypothetical protein